GCIYTICATFIPLILNYLCASFSPFFSKTKYAYICNTYLKTSDHMLSLLSLKGILSLIHPLNIQKKNHPFYILQHIEYIATRIST
ncbi:hypothetical protein, partial [Plasmodium yoelii yoelii]